jgi:hypothetical protein
MSGRAALPGNPPPRPLGTFGNGRLAVLKLSATKEAKEGRLLGTGAEEAEKRVGGGAGCGVAFGTDTDCSSSFVSGNLISIGAPDLGFSVAEALEECELMLAIRTLFRCMELDSPVFVQTHSCLEGKALAVHAIASPLPQLPPATTTKLKSGATRGCLLLGL